MFLKVFSLFHSGVFELNFMDNQPASGYYQFSVVIGGDSRFVANHVEVLNWIFDACYVKEKKVVVCICLACVPCLVMTTHSSHIQIKELTSAFNS